MRRAVSLILLVVMAACASTSGYGSATREYNANAAAYKEAGDKIASLRAIGKVSEAQWDAFTNAQAEVRAVDAYVYADLNQWKTTGVKPAAYDQHAKALSDAQKVVIQLSTEVSL